MNRLVHTTTIDRSGVLVRGRGDLLNGPQRVPACTGRFPRVIPKVPEKALVLCAGTHDNVLLRELARFELRRARRRVSGVSGNLMGLSSATPTGMASHLEGLIRVVFSTHSLKVLGQGDLDLGSRALLWSEHEEFRQQLEDLGHQGVHVPAQVGLHQTGVDGIDADVGDAALPQPSVQLEGEHQVPQLRVAVSLPRVVPSPRVVHVAQVELAKRVCRGAGRASAALRAGEGGGKKAHLTFTTLARSDLRRGSSISEVRR